MFLLAVFLELQFSANGKLTAQTSDDTTALYLDIPLIDLPYQSFAARATGNFLQGYANPGMHLSLAMSDNLYSTAHLGIQSIVHSKSTFLDILFSNGIAMAFDLVTLYTPLGSRWLHEEYHRAVLTRREIGSFDDMNTFPFGKNEISVRKIPDSDLIHLSDNHKADFRRLMTAGIEGQYHQVRTLQLENFLFRKDLPNLPLYWISTMSSLIYVMESSTDYFDKVIDETTRNEGPDISKRDFTGPDFTAWADALFNPEKPYIDRGIHPSGTGIDRYIRPSELTDEETAYLRKQGNLQLLNLISPNLYGFSRIRLKSTESGDFYGNFALRHILTPSGNDISLDLFYQTPLNTYLVTLHGYSNKDHTFPGIEAVLIDKTLITKTLYMTARVSTWLQPEDLSFTADNGTFGGLLGVRLSYAAGSFFPYMEVEGKTRGWVMGNEFLDPDASIRFGCTIRMMK